MAGVQGDKERKARLGAFPRQADFFVYYSKD